MRFWPKCKAMVKQSGFFTRMREMGLLTFHLEADEQEHSIDTNRLFPLEKL